MDHQREWAKDASGYRALNAWKEAVEARGGDFAFEQVELLEAGCSAEFADGFVGDGGDAEVEVAQDRQRV